MRYSVLSTIVVAMFAVALTASETEAQSGTRAGSLYDLNPANSMARDILNRPTVSPYLNLLGTDGLSGGAARYQTLVRPQLQARRDLLANSARIGGVQRQLQQLTTAIGGVSSQQSLRTDYPFTTGHPSVYLNGSHYYPALGR